MLGSSLASILPLPNNAPVMVQERPPTRPLQVAKQTKTIPPYGNRSGWIPRAPEDFGDGGAFPEIHVAQYPLNMGRKEGESSKTVPITVDAQGRVKYEAIVNIGGQRQVFARHEDSVGQLLDEENLSKPDEEEEARVAAETRQALEAIVNTRISAAQAPRPDGVSEENKPKFIRYTPAQQSAQFNSGASTRIIRMTEMPTDPLEPPKFKHKKIPRGPPSPPVPVMHSPPRKVTVKDQQEWKIPPCISNWKNNKGYTIPLDKRLAADGRGLQEYTVNDNFAKFTEALYIAERNAREEVAKRAEVDRRIKLKQKEKKEEMLRRLAQEARVERTTTQIENPNPEDEDEAARRERDKIREERRRERERELRLQRNKSASARNLDRDIGEKIALGQAVPVQAGSETLYDQRLFNQSQGLDSGFGDDEAYNIYNKPLFTGSSTTLLHRPKKNEEEYGTEEDYKKLLDTSKFKPDKGFSGTEGSKDQKSQGRSKPVEFEKDEADPFGLDEFLSKAKTGGKGALDKIGSSGHMNVASANLTSGGSKRARIDFEGEKSEKSRKR